MKKVLCCLLCLVALSAVLFGLSGCANTPEAPDDDVPDTGESVYYTLSFAFDGGALAGDDQLSGGLQVKEGTVLPLASYLPHKEGYRFVGFSVAGKTYAATDSITVNGNMTLTVYWEKIPSYTLSFVLDGGKLQGETPTGLTASEGSEIALAPYIPTKPGYVFGGYVCGERRYDANSVLTLTQDMTLTAEWVAIPTHTLYFNPNGGSIDNAVFRLNEGQTLALAELTPVKEGWEFAGWLRSDGMLFRTDETITANGVMIFSAQWVRAVSPVENFVFSLNEDETGYILTGIAAGSDMTHIVVPGEYLGKPVVGIGRSVFSYLPTVKSIDLSRCTALVSIGMWNFNNCASLTQVTLSGCTSLQTIGGSCFVTLPSLAQVDLSGLTSLEQIGDGCFTWNGFRESYMPVKALDFSDCLALREIGQMSFWNLSELQVLDFSKTKLGEVGRQVIKNCPKLARVLLPATLSGEKIGYEFITDTDALEQIWVDELNLYLCVQNGALYDSDLTVLYKFPAASAYKTFKAPASLTTIKGEAFENATRLCRVDLTACLLQSVEWSAFAGCENAKVVFACNSKGQNPDGTTVSFGSRWNNGLLAEEYGTVIEITLGGLPKNNVTVAEELEIAVGAVFGNEECKLSVTVNSKAVEGENGHYLLPLAVGQNDISVLAEYEDQRLEKKVTVERVEGDPTAVTDLGANALSWYGNSLSFTITAKDAAGQLLPKSAVSILYNWGYGSYKQTNGVTLSELPDGRIKATVSYDDYYDFGYFFDDTEITLIVKVEDRGLSSTTSCTVDWRVSKPTLRVDCGLTNGAETTYDTPLSFTLTAYGIDGKKLGKEALSMSFLYNGYRYQFGSMATATVTEGADGSLSVTLDFATMADFGYFGWDDADLTLTLTVAQQGVDKTLTYSISWRE